MNNEREAIKRKVHALLQKTVQNGCTESEAMLAAEVAGRLMDDYDLTITDIELRSAKCVHFAIDTKKKVHGYMDRVSNALGAYCDGLTWYTRPKQKKTVWSKGAYRVKYVNSNVIYNIFGLEQDVKVWEYLYHLIDNSIKWELAKFKKSRTYQDSSTHGKKLSYSFLYGLVSRITKRIRDMKDGRVREAELSGRSLVAIKTDHVEKELYATLGIKLKFRKATTRDVDWEAYDAGLEAANNIPISKAINEANGVELLEDVT